MKRVKSIIIIYFILFFNTLVVAQINTIGTPFITNYSRVNYQGGSQNWGIEEGTNGMMYFANNNGLLEFDGNYWNIYSLPNKSVLRSIKMGNEDLLYAGGFNEIGYFKIGKMGGATYTSITHLIPEDLRDFRDVWGIFIHPDGIIYQTYNQLMFFKEDTIKVIAAPSSFHFSFLIDNEYYINDLEKGLLRYAMGKLHPLIGMESLKGEEIWGMLSMDNKLLIATASKGIFTYDGNSLNSWQTQANQFLIQNQIYSFSRLSDNLVAVGTIQNGLLICDNNGYPVKHINMDDGLQNNTILCINKDSFGNLWLGTDLGIDYVEINSPLSKLSYNYGLATGYAAIEFNDHFYFGTNQGLFVKESADIKNEGFEVKKTNLIDGTFGQVWTVNVIDNHLFCGHHNGTFLIKEKTAEKITETPGGWTYLQIPNDSSKIIGGNYLGLALYQKKNKKWTFSKQLKGFSESARSLAFDQDGTLWMAHGYKGIFHIIFNNKYDSIIKVEHYNDKNSSLSSLDAGLAKINNKIIFTSDQNIYSFSSEKNDFVKDENLVNLFKGRSVKSIKEDMGGNIWYFQNNNAEVLRIREDGTYGTISLPFKEIKDEFVKGFEFVYPLGAKDVIFGSENGFIHYNSSMNKKYDYQFRTFLRSMRLVNTDSIYFISESTNDIVLEYHNKDIEFILSANDYENPDQITYSTFMEGYDKDWSTWQTRGSRNFTNLDEGSYQFRVKAKNFYGNVTDEVSVSFKIYPPFYRTVTAYIVYAIAILVLLFLFGLMLKRRFEKAKLKSQKEQQQIFKRKEEEFQREALEAEKQIIKSRNDKLRAEMKMRDMELANQTMQMIQNNKFLISQKKSLEQIASKLENPDRKFEINSIIRRNVKAIESENQWQIFQTHFENVHAEFLKRIKTAFPDLSPVELKLCAYLRMNISSKEIAVLMNISVRGVEISRYRLRKKLNLTRNINLVEFIITF